MSQACVTIVIPLNLDLVEVLMILYFSISFISTFDFFNREYISTFDCFYMSKLPCLVIFMKSMCVYIELYRFKHTVKVNF